MPSTRTVCPKIVRPADPVSLSITKFGMHLQPGRKKYCKIINFHTAKLVREQKTVSLHF